MPANYVQVSPQSTGLKVDTSELTVGANTVERQNLCVADPTTAANIANVVAKGTQANYAVGTQDLKDSGRISVNLSNAGVAATTTETLVTLTIAKSGLAATSASSYTVTSGKTLRIQMFGIMSSNTSPVAYVLNLRGNTSGTVTTSSNLLAALGGIATSTYPSNLITVTDGFEVAGGTSIGFGFSSSSTGTAIYLSIFGYEY